MNVLRRVGSVAREFLSEILTMCRWIGEWRVTGFTVLGVLASIVLAGWLGTESAIQLTGLGLQLLGIFTVVVNLRRARVRFDQPGFIALVADVPRPVLWTQGWG